MTCLLCHLKSRAKEMNIAVPDNYKETLDKYKKIAKENGYILTFSVFKAGYAKSCEATSFLPGRIIVSLEWAAMLVLNDEESTENAFQLTIGHEIGHRKDFPKKFYLCRCRKFISWVNEVHHDFYGAKIMVGSNKQKLIEGIKYKIQMKPDNKDSKTHPSWKRRLGYAQSGKFDSDLIEQIAKDAGCKDKELIQRVCFFYCEPIILIEDSKEKPSEDDESKDAKISEMENSTE